MGAISEQIADEICDEIAQQVCEGCVGFAYGQAQNNGQLELVGDIEGDIMDQVDGVSNGESEEITSDHPEAIGIICQAVSEMLAQGAEVCQQIRETAEALPF